MQLIITNVIYKLFNIIIFLFNSIKFKNASKLQNLFTCDSVSDTLCIIIKKEWNN